MGNNLSKSFLKASEGNKDSNKQINTGHEERSKDAEGGKDKQVQFMHSAISYPGLHVSFLV